MSTFPLTITNVGEILFEGSVQSVTCPGTDGELTVLAGHTPLVTTLKPGVIHARMQDGEEKTISVNHGMLEIGKKETVILL